MSGQIESTGHSISLEGALSALFAFSIWGLIPIYWKLLKIVPPMQVLCHRVAWSSLFLFLLLLLSQRLKIFMQAMDSSRQMGLMAISTLLIGINWYIYIWSITNNYILQSSLGYFLNPLLNVVLGMVFFQEKLRFAQKWAVSLAAVGVAYITFKLGHIPWISLSLAITFALYGMVRKLSTLDSLTCLFVETLMMLLPSLGYLFAQQQVGSGAYLNSGSRIDLLLMGGGIVTTLPLLLFGNAAKKLPLSTLGLFQYLSPSLQFVVAVFIFHEDFTFDHLVSFVFIWLALFICTAEGMWHRRAKIVQHLRRKRRKKSLTKGLETP